MPRTTEERIAPRLESACGRQIGDGLALSFNPEFLREGAAIKDFFGPPFTVVGGVGADGCAVAESLYAGIDAPLFATRSEEHTSELQSLMRISYAVFCLNKK